MSGLKSRTSDKSDKSDPLLKAPEGILVKLEPKRSRNCVVDGKTLRHGNSDRLEHVKHALNGEPESQIALQSERKFESLPHDGDASI